MEVEPITSHNASEIVIDQTFDLSGQDSKDISSSEVTDFESESESVLDFDQNINLEKNDNTDSDIEELAKFGNSNQSLSSQILFNIIISEINLGEEKAHVMSVIHKNRIDLAQVDLRLNKGEIEIKQIGAARVARIIRELGNHDVRCDVYQVPL